VSVQKRGITTPKAVNFLKKFAHKFASKGRILCTILTKFSAFMLLFVAFMFLI